MSGLSYYFCFVCSTLLHSFIFPQQVLYICCHLGVTTTESLGNPFTCDNRSISTVCAEQSTPLLVSPYTTHLLPFHKNYPWRQMKRLVKPHNRTEVIALSTPTFLGKADCTYCRRDVSSPQSYADFVSNRIIHKGIYWILHQRPGGLIAQPTVSQGTIERHENPKTVTYALPCNSVSTLWLKRPSPPLQNTGSSR